MICFGISLIVEFVNFGGRANYVAMHFFVNILSLSLSLPPPSKMSSLWLLRFFLNGLSVMVLYIVSKPGGSGSGYFVGGLVSRGLPWSPWPVVSRGLPWSPVVSSMLWPSAAARVCARAAERVEPRQRRKVCQIGQP